MKIRIMDLMDYYHDDSVKLASPEALEQRRAGNTTKHTPAPAAHRGKRPLLVAAVLLLVLTAAVAVPLTLSRTAQGGAMTEVDTPESTPELETFGGSALEDAENTVEIPSDLLAPQVLEGTWDWEKSYFGWGNLFYINDSYYTMTESGPEPIALQNLTTTVDFHGSWELNIDYAVIDGELVFYDNSDTQGWYVIDGEKVSAEEYHAQQEALLHEMYLENPQEEPILPDDGAVWVTPKVAVAYPLACSADTVQLRVRRDDIEYVDNMRYPFFYNIFTGEITDPLSNVPELFDHGELGSVIFNSSLTRAIVETWGEVVYSDSSTGAQTYVCDLVSGEMTLITDLLKPYLPDPGVEDTSWYENGICETWADDDTLMFAMVEAIPLAEEDMVADEYGFIDEWERHIWLFAYNMADGSLRYRIECSLNGSFINNVANTGYLHNHVYNRADDSETLQTIDTATGAVYTTGDQHFPINYSSHDLTDTKRLYYYSSGALYLIDDVRLGWIDLSAYLQLPTEEITAVMLLGDNGLALATADRLYCYTIPADLPMNPLTAQ